MAARTFKLKDASSTGYGTLTEATATAQTMGSGWTVATTTANAFSTMLYGTTRAANTFTTGTDQLSTQANFATGQAWRTDLPINGTFSSATNWTFNTVMIAVSTAASQTGRIKARIWKSSDPVGATANQIQLTIATAAGFLTGTTSAALTKTTGSTSTFTWTPTGIPAFNNEYLFVSMEWNTVAAGTRAGADAIFVATANSNVITSDFTPGTTQATAAESISLADNTNRTGLYKATATDSITPSDSQITQNRFISFVGAATASQLFGTTTLTLPTTLKAGDVVYVITGDSANSIPGTMSTPGYTSLVFATASASGANIAAYRKVMGATPDTTAVINNSTAANSGEAVAYCLRGVDQTTPEDVASTLAQGPESGGNPTNAPITTITDGSWILLGTNINKSAIVTAPSGYTNLFSTQSMDPFGVAAAVSTELHVHGTATPGQWSTITTSTANWAAVTIAARLAQIIATGTESITLIDAQSARVKFTPLFVTEVISPADSQSSVTPYVPKYTRIYYAFSPTQLFVRFGFKQIGAITAVKSVNETITLTDTQSVKKTTTSTAVESITPVDTQSARYRTLVTGSETISATDAQSAVKRTLSTSTESLSLVDTQSSQRTTKATASESITETDTQSAIKRTLSTSTEVLSLTDTATTKRFTNATSTESISLVDSQSGLRRTSATQAESIALVDIQSSIYRTLVTGAETLSFVDSATATKIASTISNVSEVIVLTDTQSAILRTQLFLTETIAPVDSQSAIKRTLASVSETITETDTQSATKSTKATGSETISPVDSQSSLRTTKATATESITPVDSQSSIKRTLATAAESIALTDTQTKTVRTLATSSEAITLLDSSNATKPVISATAAESISLTDTQTRARFAPVSVSETISLSDNQTTKARFGTTQTETISLLDSQSAIERTRVTVSESISLSDNTNGTVIGFGIAQCQETISPQDSQDATLISGQRVDTHDGVGKKKKKKKRLDFSEEIDRRERIRKQIQDVMYSPEVKKPPEEPEAAPVEVKPTKPPLDLKPIAPAVDYAGLAQAEIIAKIKQEAVVKAKQEQERLELKRREEAQEEEDLQLILQALREEEEEIGRMLKELL